MEIYVCLCYCITKHERKLYFEPSSTINNFTSACAYNTSKPFAIGKVIFVIHNLCHHTTSRPLEPALRIVNTIRKYIMLSLRGRRSTSIQLGARHSITSESQQHSILQQNDPKKKIHKKSKWVTNMKSVFTRKKTQFQLNYRSTN
ncbi:uncharacterized protein LOC112688206 [Sipha flava]|uniref:Uncharacterized protein LOC112688206 n=1 Tax=Sipha flava TaxID=143950 RepID=A0A8B8G245_9HEMI|nr:uncharacterized protein LOC112688206 [Sipha flava]